MLKILKLISSTLWLILFGLVPSGPGISATIADKNGLINASDLNAGTYWIKTGAWEMDNPGFIDISTDANNSIGLGVGAILTLGGAAPTAPSPSYVLKAENLYLNGGIFTILGGSTLDTDRYGLWINNIFSQESGTLLINAGNGNDSYGLKSISFVLKGGEINVFGGVGQRAHGITLDNDFTQTGGTTIIRGGSGTSAHGMRIFGTYSLQDGTLKIFGGSSNNAVGIMSPGSFTQSTGLFESSGGSGINTYGLYLDGSTPGAMLIVSSGYLNATGGTGIDAHGIYTATDFKINGNIIINAIGGKGNGASGIVVTQDILQSSGYLHAGGGSEAGTNNLLGLSASGFSQSGGTFIANGGGVTGAHGAQIINNFSMNGGTFFATGGNLNGVNGVLVGQNFNQGNGSIFVYGATANATDGLMVTGNFVQTGGNLTATGNSGGYGLHIGEIANFGGKVYVRENSIPAIYIDNTANNTTGLTFTSSSLLQPNIDIKNNNWGKIGLNQGNVNIIPGAHFFPSIKNAYALDIGSSFTADIINIDNSGLVTNNFSKNQSAYFDYDLILTNSGKTLTLIITRKSTASHELGYHLEHNTGRLLDGLQNTDHDASTQHIAEIIDNLESMDVVEGTNYAKYIVKQMTPHDATRSAAIARKHASMGHDALMHNMLIGSGVKKTSFTSGKKILTAGMLSSSAFNKTNAVQALAGSKNLSGAALNGSNLLPLSITASESSPAQTEHIPQLGLQRMQAGRHSAGVWLTPLYSYHKYKARSYEFTDSDAKSYGFSTGLSYGVENLYGLGVGVHYIQGKYDADFADIDIDTFGLTLGGRKYLDWLAQNGADKGAPEQKLRLLFIEGSLGYSLQKYDQTRQAFEYKQGSTYDLNIYSAELAVGYDLYWEDLRLTPRLGTVYSYSTTETYKENNIASGYAMQVDTRDAHSVVISINAELEYELSRELSLFTRAGSDIQCVNRKARLYTHNINSPTLKFLTKGEREDTLSGTFGLGLSYDVSSNWKTGIAYDLSISRHSEKHTGSLMFNYSF